MTGATRPLLHLTARSGWVNDPLGLTYRDGTYHLYYQHVPARTEWAVGCHWGHASSPDLLHWTEHAVALSPDAQDAGCWSGSVVREPGGPHRLFYTSVGPPDLGVGRVRVATAQDDALADWRKEPGIAVRLPAGVAARTFRDPFVLRHSGRWWMLVGAGLDDGTATALTFVSDDLRSWTYHGPLAGRHRDEMDPVWTGGMWECPQLVAVGGRHVLVVSVWDADVLHHVACAVGDLEDGRLVVHSWHRLTWGPSYYAASAFSDRDGHPGLVLWLREVGDAAAGWVGAVSLPYLLSLEGDRPVLSVHPAVAGARQGAAPSAALDVEWSPSTGPAGSTLRLVTCDGAEVVTASTRGGSVLLHSAAGTVSAPYDGGALRVVLDGPVLEVAGRSGLVALPVPASRGVRPEAAASASLRWWSLA